MTVVIAIDSFKGCLSSAELNDAAAEGVRAVCPNAEIRTCAVADGGEGTVDALAACGGLKRTVEVSDPLGRKVKASYVIRGELAVIESAAASGLTLLKPEERDPLRASSRGTGELIADALAQGCDDFIIGIGGSATCDCGMGMLAALGCGFSGAASLEQVERVVLPKEPIWSKARFRVACDVDNPLYGPNGAACVFAPQKGAGPETVRRLDKGLAHFASVVKRELHVDIATMPGAGAAGGLGAAFAGFLGAALVPGAALILDALHFDSLLEGADWVLTGEGRLDAQSAAGKTPVGVARAAKKFGLPVVAIGGAVAEDAAVLYGSGIDAMFGIAPRPMTLEEAMNPATARANVRRTAEAIARVMREKGK
jgi:glycerate kinase